MVTANIISELTNRNVAPENVDQNVHDQHRDQEPRKSFKEKPVCHCTHHYSK